MGSKGGEARKGLRWAVFSFIAMFAAMAVINPADARPHRKRTAGEASQSANPRYADIVVDVNSGAVLHSVNADARRHPASLTKIMTLYLLFERLEAGKRKRNTPLPVSAHAASQAPSKLGLKPGSSISVEDAILATVTRSANDVAVIIAEALGGDEDTFAKLMTQKARSLGMSRTVYMNASGLPDDDQITTARDQATLGRAIYERFPQYYKYFATKNFHYRGKSIGNHNRLLGKVTGVDGIKTGYTRASGFNLVTSLRRGNRHLIAVVLGGRSAGVRDARMRNLVEEYVVVASTKRTGQAVAEAAEPAPRNSVQRLASAIITPAKADPAPTAAIPTPTPAAAVKPGSSDPLLPVLVKTVSVKPASVKTASLGPLPPSSQAAANPLAAPSEQELSPSTASIPVAATQKSLPPAPTQLAAAGPMPLPSSQPAPIPQRDAHRSGWLIQVGAFDQEKEAKVRLASAQSRAKDLLEGADPFTERVVKGEKALYRARFAGLAKEQAEAACRYLKKHDIACVTLKN